jgi:hypothetical protein
VGFYPFRGPDAPLTRGPSYRMARGCARVGARGLSFTSRGFTLIDADHRLGHESRICADGRGSPSWLRVADLRRWSRITGSVASRGFAPMPADHSLGHELRMRADGRGSPARSRVADSHAWTRITGSVTSCGLRRGTRITGSVTSRGCARIASGDSECRSESTLPLASLILQRPSRGSVAIPPYSRIGNRRKTNVLGWPDACDTWPA